MIKSGLLFTLATLAASPAAFAGTLNVPSQYSTIQKAIDAAVNGDLVKIANGTYKENIDLKGKAITLQGASRKGVVIDGSKGGACVTIKSAETAATVIKTLSVKFGTGVLIGTKRFGGGFYIAGGADPTLTDVACGYNSATQGAGMYIELGSDPLIEDSLIANNVTASGGIGGGMYIAGNPTLDDDRIAENTALAGTGGGVYLVNSKASLANSEIDSNLANYGGGVHVNGGSPSITTTLFETNSVLTAPQSGEGAGLAVVGKGTPWVSGNEFRQNTAHSGAGIYVYDASPSIVANLIHDNVASMNKGSLGYGGGLSLGKGGGSIELNEIYFNDAALGGGISARSSTATVVMSNVIDNNDTGAAGLGGGVYSKDSDPPILANTIVFNYASSGGGLYVTGNKAPKADTTIVFFNSATTGASYFDGTGLLLLEFCDVEAAAIGGSSLSIDPRFVNAATRDYRLSVTSPVIDAGNFTFSSSGSDVYGAARVIGGRIDMGAAEQ